jgi:hypothetical protein
MLPTVLRKQNVHLWFVIVGAAARVVSLAVVHGSAPPRRSALYSAAEAVGLWLSSVQPRDREEPGARRPFRGGVKGAR